MDSFRSGQKENNTKIFLKNQEETVRTNQFYLTICINQKLYELFIILNIKILKRRMQQTHRHTNIGGTHAHITHGSLSRDTFLGKHSSNIVLPLSENSPKKFFLLFTIERKRQVWLKFSVHARLNINGILM